MESFVVVVFFLLLLLLLGGISFFADSWLNIASQKNDLKQFTDQALVLSYCANASHNADHAYIRSIQNLKNTN